MRVSYLAVIAALAIPTVAQAASITNGSFEQGVNPGAFTTVFEGDSTSIVGWTVGRPTGEQNAGSVDYIGDYWQAAQGVRSIDLAGNSLGSISQLLGGTLAGTRYVISYFVSKNPDGGAASRTGTISAGGTTSTFTYAALNSRPNNMLWERRTFAFVGTGTDTLTFAADTTAGCCFGPAIDNVAIAVPEPTTWAMMIGGFGLIGAAMRRRVQGAVAIA